MSKQTASAAGRPRPIEIVQAGLKRRYAEERRFRLYGKLAIAAGLLFLTLLFTSIVANGYSAFVQSFIQLEVYFDPETLDPQGTRDLDQLRTANYGGLVKQSLRNAFPDVSDRREKRALYGLVSSGADFELRSMVLADPDIIGSRQTLWVPADDDVDMFLKGHIQRETPESDRRVKDNQIAWVDRLVDEGISIFLVEHRVDRLDGAQHAAVGRRLVNPLQRYPGGVVYLVVCRDGVVGSVEQESHVEVEMRRFLVLSRHRMHIEVEDAVSDELEGADPRFLLDLTHRRFDDALPGRVDVAGER